MLVLSREKNQAIICNRDIRIVVVEIRGDKVRLGIEAPREVPIDREEVHLGKMKYLEALQREGSETPKGTEAG